MRSALRKLALKGPSAMEVHIAELESKLAQARVEALEKELAAARARHVAQSHAQGVAQFADDALQAVPACLEQVAPPTSPESPACASEGSHQVVPLVDMAPALQAPETPSVPLPTPAKRQRTSEALVEDPCQSGPCISLDQTPKASVARGSSEAVVVLSGDGASSSKGDQQDPKTQQLVEMGFSRRSVELALQQNRGSAELAVGQLLKELEDMPSPLEHMQSMGFDASAAADALQKHGRIGAAVQELVVGRSHSQASGPLPEPTFEKGREPEASQSEGAAKRARRDPCEISAEGEPVLELPLPNKLLDPESHPGKEATEKKVEHSEATAATCADAGKRPKSKAKPKSKQEPAPKKKAPLKGSIAAVFEGSMLTTERTIRAKPSMPLAEDNACITLAQATVSPDCRVVAEGKCAAADDEAEVVRVFKAGRRQKFGKFLDAFGWLHLIMRNANAQMRRDLQAAKLRLPAVLDALVGSVDWADQNSVKRLAQKLQDLQERWKDGRRPTKIEHHACLLELRSGNRCREGSTGLESMWTTGRLQSYFAEACETQEILLDLVKHFPNLLNETDGEAPPELVKYSTGASATVQTVMMVNHMWSNRMMMPDQEKRVPFSVDLKPLFLLLLREIHSEWPTFRKDAKLLLKIRSVRNSGGWVAHPKTRRTGKSSETLLFGEQHIDAELKAAVGLQPAALLDALGGQQPWRAITQQEIGIEAPDSPTEGLILKSAGGEATIIDREDQLQALVSLGVIERRIMLTQQEKLDKPRFVLSHFGNNLRSWWYCENCGMWLDTRDASYSSNTQRSAPRNHRCGKRDRDRQLHEKSTAKPTVFNIEKGADLGCHVRAVQSGTDRLMLQLRVPISALQQIEYAAGVTCQRLKASVRIASACQHDMEAEAEQKVEQDECPIEEAEEQKEVSGKETAPLKRRRTELGTDQTSTAGSARFSILSCLDLPQVPQPEGFLWPLHDSQRRTVWWMASREGIAVPGFAETDTAFPGFVSVQRLSRRLGKSDVRVQLKLERYFAQAKGGLLADAVGYGKTASVLALIALSRPTCPAKPPTDQAPRIGSRATLVLVPSNLFEQWQNEIKKFLSESTKVVSIATIADLRKATVGQLQSADIVLVSCRLLVSKKYEEHLDALSGLPVTRQTVTSGQKLFDDAMRKWNVQKLRHDHERALHQMGIQMDLPGGLQVRTPDPGPQPQLSAFKEKVETKRCEATAERFCRRREGLLQRTKELLELGQDLKDLTAPPLEIFFWHRLVVDELHEPLRVLRDAAGLRQEGPGLGMGWRALSGDARSLFHNLDGLEARSRWGLTATPPTNSAAEISFLASFHRVFVPRDSDLEAQHYLDEYLRSNGLDVSGIPITYHLIPVRPTGGERALYLNACFDKGNFQALLQLCNYFSPDGTDADMASAINSTREGNRFALERHRSDMERAEDEIHRLQTEESQGFPAARDEEDLKKRKAKLKRLLDAQPAQREKERLLESRVKYFEEVLQHLEKLEQDSLDCPICLGTIETRDCQVTACGHLFCKECIISWLGKRGKCPTCNTQLQLPAGVASAEDVLSRQKEAASKGRISRFGSKIEAVCTQLNSIWRSEPGAKVIIFVQFEVLLKKMEHALAELDMPCLTLKGTVFERRRVIRRFHAEGKENEILLLSLERSPSGMNLVCCHHLLLVHPMAAESRDAALSFERQAIGRVRRQGQKHDVHVYRFYVRETMEEEMVHKHHQELLNGKEDPPKNGEGADTTGSSGGSNEISRPSESQAS